MMWSVTNVYSMEYSACLICTKQISHISKILLHCYFSHSSTTHDGSGPAGKNPPFSLVQCSPDPQQGAGILAYSVHSVNSSVRMDRFLE